MKPTHVFRTFRTFSRHRKVGFRSSLSSSAAAFIIGLALCALALATPADATDRPPNILLILADDLGWHDLGCYGNEHIDTPHIDRLTSEGLRFTDAYAYPICTPTRVALMTGQPPERTRMFALRQPFLQPHGRLLEPQNAYALDPRIVSVADLLNPYGYTPTHIGKWHVGYGNRPWDADNVTMPPGWESYRSRAALGHHKPEPESNDELQRVYSGAAELIAWAEANPHKNVGYYTLQAARTLVAKRNEPFYICVSHNTVHTALEAREAIVQKYERRFAKLQDPPSHPTYAAMVEIFDESVQHLLDLLEALQLEENTIVIIYSDNGGQDSDGRESFITTNGPLRGNKGEPYEGGIRVPLIVRWPAVVAPGQITNAIVSPEDFLFTFADLAGATVGDRVPPDGVSFKPVLHDPQAIVRDRHFMYYPTGSMPSAVVRKGQYKLIELYEDQRLELYDLAADQGETHNLAAERIDLTRELMTDLRRWQRSIDARMPSFNPLYDPEKARQTSPRPADPWIDHPGQNQTFDPPAMNKLP